MCEPTFGGDWLHILIDAINDNAEIRGPDRYLLELLSGLAEVDRSTRYTICHAPWQKAFHAPDLPANFTTICLRPPRHRIPRVVWHALAFPYWVRRLKPDIVHLPNLIYAPWLGCPVITTVHDLAHFRFPEKFGRFRGRLQRGLIRAALRHSDCAIAVSEFTRGDIGLFTDFPNARVAVVHEGGPPVKRRESGSANGKRFFLYVGVIERSKNVEQLVVEFSDSDRLRELGYELWIAGRPGNAMSRVQRLVSEVGDGRIKLTGFVSQDQLDEFYRTCKAMIFPSLVEGFGLVLLEAMANGAPVIAMDTSVIPEVVGEAGILVDPAEVGGIRRAMERLVGDPALHQELEQKGYERLGCFSWTEAARQTRALYDSVAGGKCDPSNSRRSLLQ